MLSKLALNAHKGPEPRFVQSKLNMDYFSITVKGLALDTADRTTKVTMHLYIAAL